MIINKRKKEIKYEAKREGRMAKAEKQSVKGGPKLTVGLTFMNIRELIINKKNKQSPGQSLYLHNLENTNLQ